jgi:hypothetical protein
MRFFEVLKHAISPDPLDPQIWDCKPLVVVDDEDVVAYAGHTRVEVKPLPDGRFDLDAEDEREGWAPRLVAAERVVLPEMVQVESLVETETYWRGKRRGAAFQGKDDEGIEFTWYIGGAADVYLLERQTEDPAT